MKRSIAYCVLAVVMGIMCSCSRPDPAKKDLVRYAEQMMKITPLETKAIGAYQGEVGKNYTSDARLMAVLTKKALPKLEEFRKDLDDIHPMTNEVSGIHRLYTHKTDAYIKAFNVLIAAMRKRDTTMVAEANAYLRQTEAYHVRWESAIRALRAR